MQLHWPKSIDEAVAILTGDEDARPHAGGATLVAMMNADLLEPSALVFLRGIDALQGIERRADGHVRIGAMTTHQSVERFEGFDAGQDVVGQAARRIAHPPIRAVGTIGGAIAHGDPAADLPAALVAADAEIVCVGGAGERHVPAREFFVSYLETALSPGEIVQAVDLPAAPPGALGIYDKLARVDGDYAIVSIAAVLAIEDGVCRHARIAAAGCAEVPLASEATEAKLKGSRLDDNDIAEAAALLAEMADPVDDVRASAGYRSRVLCRMTRRVIVAIRDGGAPAT
jgi:carbon-monoxide dehydrogenase medium subunit